MKPEHIPLMPRYGQIRRLQQYAEGTQYDGKPDFWTGRGVGQKTGRRAPLRERKPCIIYPLPKAAVQQVVRFTFGEGRFPTLKVEEQKDDAYLTLTPEEAETLEHALVDVIQNACLKPTIRTLMARALSERTAVAIATVKRGRITFDVPHAKDCWPTFKGDDPSAEVLSLTWAYQFNKAVIENGRAVPKRFWFRRDVTESTYVDYDPVEVKDNGADVEWGQGTETKHDFGFCPVLWIRNLSDTVDPGGIDGFSLYEDLFDEFDALNFALSQRHRGITFFGVPQPYETGVEDGDGPEADGRTAMGYSASTSPTGLAAELMTGAPAGGSPHGEVSEKARKLAPDAIWSYQNPQVRVGLVETTGKSFEVATLHVEDIRQRLLESMSVVLASMEAFAKGGGEMNAKFLILAFAPLLNLVDELRDATWWPHGLEAALSLCLRIIARLGGEGIVMPNAAKVADLVKRFEVQAREFDGAIVSVWMLPKITPLWGDAFNPSGTEVKEMVDAAVTAKDAGLIPQKEATQYVADQFGIEDVDAAVAELEKVAQEAQQVEADNAEVAHERNIELTEAKKPPPKPAPKKAPPKGR